MEGECPGFLGRYDYLTVAQKDNYYNGQIGLTYVVNAYVSVTGGYLYLEDSSNLIPDSFTDNQFTLSASLRY